MERNNLHFFVQEATSPSKREEWRGKRRKNQRQKVKCKLVFSNEEREIDRYYCYFLSIFSFLSSCFSLFLLLLLFLLLCDCDSGSGLVWSDEKSVEKRYTV